jgi:hypothetical protein
MLHWATPRPAAELLDELAGLLQAERPVADEG